VKFTLKYKHETINVNELKTIWASASESLETLKVIEALFSCLKTRDQHTANHSLHMAQFSFGLAVQFDKSNALLYYAGSLMHDIGKLGMTDKVLKGKDILTDIEREYLREHVTDGYRILHELNMPSVMLDIVRYHHERYDGSGYLEGLLGTEIPLAGRITAITDTYSALTSDRPYSKAIGKRKALDIMLKDSNQFDPRILPYFINTISLSNTT
jgi:putative nucleotidyltransferase with HDIG domain